MASHACRARPGLRAYVPTGDRCRTPGKPICFSTRFATLIAQLPLDVSRRMLAFLLDEHVSPDVAVIVRRSRPEIPVFALLEWLDGIWIGESDEEILRAARAEALTL
jgi:hypothetical protein